MATLSSAAPAQSIGWRRRAGLAGIVLATATDVATGERDVDDGRSSATTRVSVREPPNSGPSTAAVAHIEPMKPW